MIKEVFKRIGAEILGVRGRVLKDDKIKSENKENTIRREVEKMAVRVVEDFIKVNNLDKKHKHEWIDMIIDQFNFEQEQLKLDILPEGMSLNDLKKDLLRLRGVFFHELIVKFTDLYPKTVDELAERLIDLDIFWESELGRKRMGEMGLDSQQISNDRKMKKWIFGPAEQANLQTVLLSGKVGLVESLHTSLRTIERVREIFAKIEEYFGSEISLVHPTLAHDQVARSTSPKSGMVFPLSADPKDKKYDFARLLPDNALKDSNGRPISGLMVDNSREKIEKRVNKEVVVEYGKHRLEKLIDQISEYREIVGVRHMVQIFQNKDFFYRFGVEKSVVDQMTDNLKNKRDKQIKSGSAEITRKDFFAQLAGIENERLRAQIKEQLEKEEEEYFKDVDRYIRVVIDILSKYNEAYRFDKTEFNYLQFAREFNNAFLDEFFPGMEMDMVFIDNEERGDFGYFFKYVKEMGILMDYMVRNGFLDRDDLVVRISIKDSEESPYRKYSQYRWDAENQCFTVNKNKNKDGTPSPDYSFDSTRDPKDLPSGNIKETITLKEIQDDPNVIAIPLKELEYLMVGSGLLSKVVLLDDGVVYPPLRTLSRAIKIVTSTTGSVDDGIAPCYYPSGEVKSRY